MDSLNDEIPSEINNKSIKLSLSNLCTKMLKRNVDSRKSEFCVKKLSYIYTNFPVFST